MAHIRQSRLDFGRGFHVQDVKTRWGWQAFGRAAREQPEGATPARLGLAPAQEADMQTLTTFILGFNQNYYMFD